MAAAHRGGSLFHTNLGRENTLFAFGQAVALGYRYLETDVHVTRDGHLVLHHDPELDRTTDRGGRIAEMTLRTVREARVGGIDQIPTLDEALEAFPDRRFLVDIKDSGAVKPLVSCLSRHGAWDRVSVGSFSASRLRRFRRLSGTKATTAGDPLDVVVNLVVPSGLLRAPAAFQIPPTWRFGRWRLRVLTRAFVERAHARGAAVHVWTINNRTDLNAVLDMGVDGIVTDAIDVARDVLRERGLWEES